MNGTKRKWTATEKMRIVMTGLQKDVDVAELCRREGISPTQYYGWKKILLSSATKVFEDRRQKQDAAEAKKDAKIQRMQSVIAEITAENLELKKRFRFGGSPPGAAAVAEGEELKDLVQAQGVMARIIKRYNEERLHSALGYLRPVDYYRGDPQAKKEARRLKMAQARHRRRERNLNLEQPTLPYTAEDPVANP